MSACLRGPWGSCRGRAGPRTWAPQAPTAVGVGQGALLVKNQNEAPGFQLPEMRAPFRPQLRPLPQLTASRWGRRTAQCVCNLKFVIGKGSAAIALLQSHQRCLHRGAPRRREVGRVFQWALPPPAPALLSESCFISGQVLCQAYMTRIHEGLLNLFSIALLLSSL